MTRPRQKHAAIAALEAAFTARGLAAEWERFRRFLAPHADGCIDWLGGKTAHGYGRFRLKGRLVYPHRLVCELLHPLQRGKPLALHACDRPTCCSPLHLSWGTQSLNTLHQWQRTRKRPQLALQIAEVA